MSVTGEGSVTGGFDGWKIVRNHEPSPKMKILELEQDVERRTVGNGAGRPTFNSGLLNLKCGQCVNQRTVS